MENKQNTLLTKDVWQMVFSHVPGLSARNAALTCRFFNQALSGDVGQSRVWDVIGRREFPGKFDGKKEVKARVADYHAMMREIGDMFSGMSGFDREELPIYQRLVEAILTDDIDTCFTIISEKKLMGNHKQEELFNVLLRVAAMRGNTRLLAQALINKYELSNEKMLEIATLRVDSVNRIGEITEVLNEDVIKELLNSAQLTMADIVAIELELELAQELLERLKTLQFLACVEQGCFTVPELVNTALFIGDQRAVKNMLYVFEHERFFNWMIRKPTMARHLMSIFRERKNCEFLEIMALVVFHFNEHMVATAISIGDDQLLRYCLDGECDYNYNDLFGSFLHIILESKRTAWLEHFAKNMSPETLAVDNRDRDTAIHIAARDNDLAAVEVLLRYMSKTVVGKSNNKGLTALHYAAMNNNAQMIKLLITHMDQGAIDERENETGKTALHYVAGQKNIKAIILLLKCMGKAAICAKSFSHYTSYDYSRRRRCKRRNNAEHGALSAFLNDANDDELALFFKKLDKKAVKKIPTEVLVAAIEDYTERSLKVAALLIEHMPQKRIDSARNRTYSPFASTLHMMCDCNRNQEEAIQRGKAVMALLVEKMSPEALKVHQERDDLYRHLTFNLGAKCGWLKDLVEARLQVQDQDQVAPTC